MKKSSIIPGLLAFLLAGGVLTGCSQATTQSKMSAKEQESFKGGPMPESARVEMMKRMAAANAKTPSLASPKK